MGLPDGSPQEAQSFFQCGSHHERITDDGLIQLRGVLGASQWPSHQTAPHLASKLGQLQSEILRATVGTVKAGNGLEIECFHTRHFSTRMNKSDVV